MSKFTPIELDFEPRLVVISGASCSGKTTILNRLVETYPDLERPVTTTTRPRREDEIDGIDYHFVTEEKFKLLVRFGEFLEHQKVHGKDYYGLTFAEVSRIRRERKTPVVILDVQGAREVRARIKVIDIFIVPESKEEAIRRIAQHRQGDAAAERIQSVPIELAAADEFTMVVKNPEGRLDEAYDQIAHICEQTLGVSVRGRKDSHRTMRG